MSLWGYGLIFSIFGWSNRELIFKDSDLKQWFLKVIFSSSCDKENNNCPKEINFQIPEAAKKEIKKLKISQAFGPQMPFVKQNTITQNRCKEVWEMYF